MRLLLPLFFLGLSHCAYKWGNTDRSLPGGHKTVFVEIFENQTQEPGIEHNFTQALVRELERSGFAVVTTKGQAELVLIGSIISLSHDGGGSDRTFESKDYSNPDPAQRTSKKYAATYFVNYNLTVVTNLQAVRSRDKQMIWQTALHGADSYRGALLFRQGIRNSNVLYNQSRKKQTIKLIAEDMMSEAFDRLTENF